MYNDFKGYKDNFFQSVNAQANIFKEVIDLQVSYLNDYSELAIAQAEKISNAKDAQDISNANVGFFNSLKDHNTKYFNESTKLATKAKDQVNKDFEHATKEAAKTSAKK